MNGIVLKNGSFENSDELLLVMEQSVTSLYKGTIVINKKVKN